MLNQLGYNDTMSLSTADSSSGLTQVRVDEWFKFSNFHLYAFSQGKVADFETFYFLMIGLIAGTLIGIYAMAD